MGKRVIRNYVRSHRIRTGLTQEDLAFLLDLDRGQTISRYEQNDLVPRLKTALIAAALFDVSSGELFPGLVQEVEQLLITRAKKLHSALTNKNIQDNPVLAHKRDFLIQTIKRLEARVNE